MKRGHNTYSVFSAEGNLCDWDDEYQSLATRWRDIELPDEYAIIEFSDIGLAIAAKDCSAI
jgi:hypothetical protein